jgi:hypothetical protein
VRLQFRDGATTVINGPFRGDNELPAAFSILHVPSLEEALEWATRLGRIVGDVEIDIRPVTEPWDIGLKPEPAELTTRRYMILRKATAATESGASSSSERTTLARLIDETTRAGIPVVAESMRPSRRGRRYKNSRNGVIVIDGPFVETKELIAGYVIVSAESLEEAGESARQYIDVVGADEVDVRELE